MQGIFSKEILLPACALRSNYRHGRGELVTKHLGDRLEFIEKGRGRECIIRTLLSHGIKKQNIPSLHSSSECCPGGIKR